MLGRVLVLSTSAGAGHLRAAEAIEKALRIRGLASEVHHLDVLRYTNNVFRHLYSKAYIELVNKAPEVLGWLYDHLDVPGRNEKVRLAFDRLNTVPFINFLNKFQPDVAICTHFLPSEIISWLKSEKKVNILNAVVVTDLDVHAMWLCRYSEQYFVALEETKFHLLALGVPESMVTVSGIPIDPVFEEAKDSRAMRRKHGLDEDRFTILVSAGGFGVGPVEHIIEALSGLTRSAQVVVVCGRNEELRARLTRVVPRFTRSPGVEFQLLGFTTEMDELMAASDLFVGKPGGLTTSEALAKGLPMVVINPIPGQEAKNTEYLLSQNVAVEAQDANDVMLFVDEFLRDPRKLWAMREAAAALGRPRASDRAAQEILQLLSAKSAVVAA